MRSGEVGTYNRYWFDGLRGCLHVAPFPERTVLNSIWLAMWHASARQDWRNGFNG